MDSVICKDRSRCFLCGCNKVAHEHHIFGGPDRQISEKYGLKVYLCFECHKGDDGVHGKTEKAKNLRKGLHMSGQLVFENYYGQKQYKTNEPEWFYDRTPREKFMQLFRMNYL